MKVNSKQFITDVKYTLLTKFLLIFLKMGISVITARILGPTGRGLFFSSIQTSGLVNTVGTISVGESLIYYIGKCKILPNQVLGVVFMMVLGFTFALSSLLYLLMPLLSEHFLHELPDGVIPLIFILIPCSMTEYLGASALRGLKAFSIVNRLSIITRTNILVIMFVALVYWSADVYTGVMAYSIALALNSIVYFVVLLYKSKFSFSVPWSETGNIINYAIRAHIGTLLTEVEYRIDIFIIMFFLNAAAVGIYSIGVTIAQILWYVSNSVNTVLFPHISSDSGKDRNLFTATVLKYTLFSNILVVLVLILVGLPLVQILYGSMFVEAYYIFIVLSPGLLFDSVARSLAAWFKGTGRVMYLSKISGISLAVNILLCIYLIPIWGVYGAALSSVISYTLRAFILAIAFGRISGINFFDMFILTREEMAVVRTNIFKQIKKVF